MRSYLPAPSPYIGRFAPSPTGPLHAGSLVAALASYLDARKHGGRWYVRMEDLDPPRETPEAARTILQTLEALALHWDGEVLYQSQRHQAYQEALQSLEQQGLAFACNCSRKQIQAAGGIYPGTCRKRSTPLKHPCAIRCRVEPVEISFKDQFQDRQVQHLGQEVGDFVLRRKDGLYAYQLAVVVDDAWQQVSHVIRGIDLLDSTPRQIYLQRCLHLPTPQYGHIPVIVNHAGQKLSKQHFAAPVDIRRPQQLLIQTLNYLRQKPSSALGACSCEEILQWAVQHWQPQALWGLQAVAEFESPDLPAV